MKLINFGSINWDHCYQVPHFVRPGETLSSKHYQKLLGGKGANQSVAASRAGTEVYHIGAVGEAEEQAIRLLSEHGVITSGIKSLTGFETGHAIIQVNDEGENAIVLFSGANQGITDDYIDSQLLIASAGDWLLLQNETNQIEYAVQQAKHKGLNIAFNPAPMDKERVAAVLSMLDLLIVNQIELQDLLGISDPVAAEPEILKLSEDIAVLVTQGSNGVHYYHQGEKFVCTAFQVNAVDTTAAGDTFIGYFLASRLSNKGVLESLNIACAASALCVTRAGAIPSIPSFAEVNQFLAERGSHD